MAEEAEVGLCAVTRGSQLSVAAAGSEPPTTLDLAALQWQLMMKLLLVVAVAVVVVLVEHRCQPPA